MESNTHQRQQDIEAPTNSFHPSNGTTAGAWELGEGCGWMPASSPYRHIWSTTRYLANRGLGTVTCSCRDQGKSWNLCKEKETYARNRRKHLNSLVPATGVEPVTY
jgi:hypothetical protein